MAGRPLVGLAADEAVELVEAGTRRPTLDRTGDRDLPWWRLVVLAERGGAIAVHAQSLGQGRDAPGAHPGVPWKGGSQLHNRTGVVRVVVVASEQRRAGGAAQRGRVKAVVFQSVRRHLLQRGHPDRAAERAGVAEADIIDQHNHHVGRTLRRFHFKARRRLGVTSIEFGDFCDHRLPDRQHRAVQPARGGRTARHVTRLWTGRT